MGGFPFENIEPWDRLDLHCHLQFNERIARQGRNTNRRANVASRLSKNFNKQIGRAVDYFRRVWKSGNGVHIAVYGDNVLYLVERTEVGGLCPANWISAQSRAAA